MIDLQLIRRVERVAMILGLIAVLLSVVSLDLRFISGVFIGAAIGWLNLVVVRILVVRSMQSGALKGTVVGAFLLKFAVLAGLVVVCVLLLGVDGTGFLVGFFALVVAVTVVPLLHGVRGTGPDHRGPQGEP